MRDTTHLATALLLAMGILSGRALAVPAFSGAEGWGAITPGGRGGQVIHVTNLNDSGPGSFRAAVTASGPRTVVFDVSGQINLASEVSITNPYLTIAGQTAPGQGITIAGETTSLDASDIIIRHIRFRRGLVDVNHRDDALGSDSTPGNIIVDHVSTSWGLDENISIYRWKNQQTGKVWPTHNVTVQWSISSEALNEFDHAFGATWGGAGGNYHHNLFASNTGRNPSISFSHFLDFRNNVSFNWQHRTADGAGPEAHVNMINNYLKSGPATNSGELQYRIVKPELRNGVAGYGEAGWWYVDGNYVNGYPVVTADNWNGGVQFELPMDPDWARVLVPHTNVTYNQPLDPNNQPIPTLPTIATQSAQDAYQSVLAGAGASMFRDAVDLRIVDSVATGVATFGPDSNGIIDNPGQAGGYPVLPVIMRDLDYDTDQDGMPDGWEVDYGLNSGDATDRNGDFDSDGFTNLEEYLNETGAFKAVKDVVWDGELSNRYARIENWNIAFQPSQFDTAVINNGTVVVDSIGQDAGTVKLGTNLGNNATLNITAGWLKAADEVIIGAHPLANAALNLSGGRLITKTLSQGAGGEFNFTGGVLSAETVGFHLENNGGTIAPGNSVGQTHVLGDLELSTTAAVEIELQSDTLADFIDVDGTATLDGNLNVVLLEGFTPDENDSWLILSAASIDGEFDFITEGYSVEQIGNDLYLQLASTVQVGDYNGDGKVSAADFTVWRDNLGAESLANRDPNNSGPVGLDDFNSWKDNYGATQDEEGLGTGVADVPEPGSLIVLLLGFVMIVWRGFMRRCAA